MTLAVWLQRHRRLGRWLVAVPLIRDWVSRRVWASYLAIPGARKDLEQGLADLAAHRTYVWDVESGIVAPDPEWPKDGPQPKPPYHFDTLEPVA